MWGAETAYNFMARRRSPTRFVYQYDLYKYADEKSETEFLNDILIQKPKLIILTAADKRLNDHHFAYRSENVGGLMDKVRLIYTLVKTPQLKGWVVYQLEGNP